MNDVLLRAGTIQDFNMPADVEPLLCITHLLAIVFSQDSIATLLVDKGHEDAEILAVNDAEVDSRVEQLNCPLYPTKEKARNQKRQGMS